MDSTSTLRRREFGESRLLKVVRQRNDRSAAELLDAVVEAVQRHSGPAQSDDLTLVIVRVRAGRTGSN
jgi:serine phosphatase RsbU (regulator of sigma subunit)